MSLNFTTDSPFSRRIVRSFIHFLNQVEPSPGVDAEGIEVARECLVEAFKINSSSVVGDPDSLIDIFMSFDANKLKLDSVKASSSLSAQNAAGAKDHFEASEPMGEDRAADLRTTVVKDELHGQFLTALEKKNFFLTNVDGSDDIEQVEKASHIFDDGFMEMERSGCPQAQFSLRNLAEALKSLGNKAMQSRRYYNALEYYSCAIAIYENSAVFYCNRAAAFTQVNGFTDAIQDCLRSIEIDPNYSKAYSRLGLAYFGQTNYRDAIDKGFKKALLLDPSNESVKENIRVAEQRLMEEQQYDANRSQNSRSSQDFRNQAAIVQQAFSSRSHSFNPSNLASMFMNRAQQGSHSQESREDANRSGANEPETRFGGNVINVDLNQIPQDLAGSIQSVVMDMLSGNVLPGQQHNEMHGSQENANSSGANEPEIQFGSNANANPDQIPQEVRGAFQSVMEMFSGNVPPGQQHDQMNGRTAPN